MDEIYDDLIKVDIEKYKERIDGLELHINKLNTDIQTLCTKMLEMRETQTALVTNISVLYKTAKSEIERKDRMIAQLRKEKDEILFRKGHYSYNKRPHSPSGSIENKRSKYNKEKEPPVQESKEISESEARTSENKAVFKPIEIIDITEVDKDVHTNIAEQSIKRSSQEKQQDRRGKEHSKDCRTSSTDSRKDKDRRKSPNAKTKENRTSKDRKDTEKSKHKADCTKTTSKQENVEARKQEIRRNSSENKDIIKPSEIIGANKDIRASQRSSRDKDRKDKECGKTSREHKEETSTSNRKNEHISKQVEVSNSTDRRKSPNPNNKENTTSKSSKDTDKSKSKAVSSKHSSSQENLKNSSSNRTNNGDVISSRRKKEHNHISSKLSSKKYISCEGDLRNKLMSKPKHKSTSSEKDLFKSDKVHKSPKKNNVTSDCKIITRLINGEDMEEGEIIDDDSIVVDTSVSKNICSKTDKNEMEHCRNTNEDLNLTKSEKTVGNTDITRSIPENEEEKITNVEAHIKTSKEAFVVETSNVKSKYIDKEPEAILSNFEIEATALPYVEFTETRINEDNIIELHINPKSNCNDIQTEMLLAQLEENEILDTTPILNLSDNNKLCNNSIEGEKEQQLNNENVNTSNNLDLVKTNDKISEVVAPKSINLSAGSRRRRRAIVFIS